MRDEIHRHADLKLNPPALEIGIRIDEDFDPVPEQENIDVREIAGQHRGARHFAGDERGVPQEIPARPNAAARRRDFSLTQQPPHCRSREKGEASIIRISGDTVFLQGGEPKHIQRRPGHGNRSCHIEQTERLPAGARSVQHADVEGIVPQLAEESRQHDVGIALERQLTADAEIDPATMNDASGLIEDGGGVVRDSRGFRGQPRERGLRRDVGMNGILGCVEHDIGPSLDNVRADQGQSQDFGFRPGEVAAC